MACWAGMAKGFCSVIDELTNINSSKCDLAPTLEVSSEFSKSFRWKRLPPCRRPHSCMTYLRWNCLPLLEEISDENLVYIWPRSLYMFAPSCRKKGTSKGSLPTFNSWASQLDIFMDTINRENSKYWKRRSGAAGYHRARSYFLSNRRWRNRRPYRL